MNLFIGELHKVFDYINHKEFQDELIRPIITVQPQKTKKKDCKVLGWCSNIEQWTMNILGNESHHHEINIVLENFEGEYEGIISTFVHEVSHLANTQLHIDDCSKRGFHNENFKEMANRLGLIVNQVEKQGFSETLASQSLLDELETLDVNKDFLNIKRIVEIKERKPTVRKPQFEYSCPSCHKKIKSKEDNMEIKCICCDEEYVKIEKEENK